MIYPDDGTGRIITTADYGRHIALRCKNHPNQRWSTKNIAPIGCRTVFYNLDGNPAMGPECNCSARDLEPVPITHFGLFRRHVPDSPMIKEAEFFVSQGGLTQSWGTGWTPIYEATSIGDARRKFALAHGVALSLIYQDEP